jgi:oxysterol-binding protein-related protein 9/10/11
MFQPFTLALLATGVDCFCFQCNWEINTAAAPITDPSKAPPQPPVDPTQVQANGSTTVTADDKTPYRISFLTEQTSHHPPVSAYWYECPQLGIVARGYDQLSAKFTGTAVRVTPGVYNRGLFVNLAKRNNEEYQLVQPAAALSGLLRGSLYVAVADTCSITCPQTRQKCILTYVEESWFGKAQNRVHGLVYRYDPADDKYTRVKDVPDKDVLAKIEGCWQEQITYTIPNSAAVKEVKTLKPTSDKQLLIDVQPLFSVPKSCPPPSEQLPNESRTFWAEVTSAITEKRFSDATRVKLELEQAQRDKAAKRKEMNTEYKPRFFTAVTDPSGKPELTEYGKQALKGLDEGNYKIPFVPEPGID